MFIYRNRSPFTFLIVICCLGMLMFKRQATPMHEYHPNRLQTVHVTWSTNCNDKNDFTFVSSPLRCHSASYREQTSGTPSYTFPSHPLPACILWRESCIFHILLTDSPLTPQNLDYFRCAKCYPFRIDVFPCFLCYLKRFSEFDIVKLLEY